MELSMQLFNKRLIFGAVLLFAVTALAIWKVAYSSKLVVVDMKRVLNQPAVLLSRTKMSEHEQAQLLMQYSAVLPEILKNYGATHHVTLISAPVIISGSVDITDTIIELTFERLKHHD